MKRENKGPKKKDGVVRHFANSKKIMSSNLPLLFANGQPRSLETISQAELEEFVPFMILCSLGQELTMKPKEINKCEIPEWWPQDFPFRVPLVDQSDWTNRQVMLKSLVCRCYTFYECEFLLKFSSELAEMAPSQLKYEENKDENTTSIYDAKGCMLVKCRNENINYDMHKNLRRYLSPTHRSPLNQTKRFEPVIDLTYDTSSEDEKEVYFKEAAARKSSKRKSSIEISEGTVSKKRLFEDFPKEEPEPAVVNQEQFMAKFHLLPHGKQLDQNEDVMKASKKRLVNSFVLLNITTKRGQDLLIKSKHTFNLEASLERINKHCSPISQEEAENNQVCTRASVIFSAMYKDDVTKKIPEELVLPATEKCYRTYKWPHRTKNPRFHYKGFSIKPCSVNIPILSDETIDFWTNKKRTIATMTPASWPVSKKQICSCQKIPLIILDEDNSPFKDKSSSTRCTCNKVRVGFTVSQEKKSTLQAKIHTREIKSNLESSMISHQRSVPDSFPIGVEGFNTSDCDSVVSFPVNHSVSFDKEGLGVIANNVSLHCEPSLKFKRSIHRTPLSVVPPSPIVDRVMHDVLCQSFSYVPRYRFSTPSNKVNFNRSILDAIKWYTKDDPISEPLYLVSDYFVKEESVMFGVDRSQENIKPLTDISLPNSIGPIVYFNSTVNVSERDYCFERSSDISSKLVTRRGGRHYVNREPCPSCFQGKDYFCVYEFIRRAKLAGITLHNNKKQLHLMFLKFIQAENSLS